MHGRLKVKTTEEQQKAKAAERAKKLKLYNAATTRAFAKRKDGELDAELLEITGQVLQVNPDFYTFWNMRKETFLAMNESMESTELQRLYRGELDFLESCLKVNPKSYGTWHHRCFVMDHMPQPDWVREMDLCNLFLQYDERNFHCWDYRRFVVKRCRKPAEEEFDFTTAKISSNFSNFSSWHYRSKLLPVLHPDLSQPSGISPNVTTSEFELVQNGLYTDPDDQSNWFYHKWLLGRGDQKQMINFMYVSTSHRRLLLSFTKPVKLDSAICDVCVNQSSVKCNWKNQDGTSAFSTLWVGELSVEVLCSPRQGGGDQQVQVQVTQGRTHLCQHSLTIPAGQVQASYHWNSSDVQTYFRKNICGVDEETLQRELEIISELQEVEDKNKWAMLTCVLLMKAADPVKHQQQIQSFLQQLQSLDSTRHNYYADLRSRFEIETTLETTNSLTSLSVKGKGLSFMSRTELLPLVQELDLSDNNLRKLNGFNFFQCLQCLDLSGNQVSDCQGLENLPCLATLDLSNNLISSAESVIPLQSCKSLEKLNLSGNALCEDSLIMDKLKEILPEVEIKLS